MQLETERLWIIPLSAKQLSLWICDIPALERELQCAYQGEPVEGIFRDIVKGQAEKTAQDEANCLYHTFWFLVRKADRVAVGSDDFKNVPDQREEVEIGYGLGKDFEGRGYMTEAVRAMCAWALGQRGVSSVIAETEKNHFASQNVLRRCGFALYRQEETHWWRLSNAPAITGD